MSRWVLAAVVAGALLGCGRTPEQLTGWNGPPAQRARSLFYADPSLLDGPDGITLGELLARISPDGHGGRLLDAWFHRFGTTPGSERYGPVGLIEAFARDQGTAPEGWDLSGLPFKVTGVHNRIDLAADDHCGELRVSFASTDEVYQPFHLLLLFRQPAQEGDLVAGQRTCQTTARQWAALSALEGEPLREAIRERLARGLTGERFVMAESVEFTVSPWEWRQWVPRPDPTGALPFVLENPPLFQAVDALALNPPGPLREAFLRFVAQNGEALDDRRMLIPAGFRPTAIRRNQGVPPTPLDLSGIDPQVSQAHPLLRQHLEIVGCPSCHTADAQFVQTRTDRTISPFYEKELAARARHLDALAAGVDDAAPPFGPLQDAPRLPQ